ncbi:cell division cycle-associated 7-like protein isoform X2 [Anoplolepis gracilipes]|uniref:cell division cycle-associated 7-like protein isoform X2 n=1 Tax=Anoplolepis gracilipes TaxID=354296 RepID=UPI003BA26AF2
MDDMDDMDENDYEALRQKNLSERKAFFAGLFEDIKKETSEIKELEKKRLDDHNIEDAPAKKRRRTGDLENFNAGKIRLQFRRTYNTRSRKKPSQRSIDLMKMGVCDVDEEEEEYTSEDDSFNEKKQKRRGYRTTKSEYDPENIPSVDEITEKMLNNVARKSSKKIYCKINGTSCHQCRQKTLDTKTVCRSGECVGVRGQFCGPCLKGRYGESAIEALKDPDWACPPCRGLCNCSICRTRSGLPPTGPLALAVQGEGYSSVMAYLQAAEINDV